MNKYRFWLIALMLVLLVVFSVGATGGTPQLKIQEALGVTDASGVHRIPVGSTIIHLPDGFTTIVGPDGNLVISVKSSEVGLIATPNGMARADHVYEVPSGSFVHGASANTTEVYDADGKLILTVIDQAGEASLETVQTSPPTYAGTGWIEDAKYGYPYESTTRFQQFGAHWTVSAAPINSWIDDDTVYLFNGIVGEGASDWYSTWALLQSVVGFNENGFWVPGNPLNGRVWMVRAGSNWDYYQSETLDVAVGDQIYGEQYKINQDPVTWQGDITNLRTGVTRSLVTDLLGTDSQYLTVVLEGWNLETDSDLFGTTDFVQLNALDQFSNPVYPIWRGEIDPEALSHFNNLGVIVYDSSHVRLRTNRVPSGVQGLVSDAATGNPLPYSTVTVTQSGQVIQAVGTDSNGRYSIALSPGIYIVTASHTGYYDLGQPVAVSDGVSTTLNFQLTRSTGGGGCPFLYVWDGSEYVGEGLLNIHNAEGVDVTYEHVLMTVPARVHGAYEFRLVEHPKTISNIDQVQLHAILEDGTVEELPLILGQHSEYGNVLNLLLKSDDLRVEEIGADHNGGTSQSIDLKFTTVRPDAKVVRFIFTIEGYNMYLK